MTYQLTIINKRGTLLYPIDKEQILIGRSSKTDLRIKDRYISRKHIIIEHSGELYFLRGLDAKNRTLLNGEVVQQNRSYLLKEEDTIKIGESSIEFNATCSDEEDYNLKSFYPNPLPLTLQTEMQDGAVVQKMGSLPYQSRKHRFARINNTEYAPKGVDLYCISPHLKENISAMGGIITTPLPYVFGILQVTHQVKQFIKRLFAKFSYCMISIVAHLILLGVLLLFYAPKSYVNDNTFEVRFGDPSSSTYIGSTEFNPDLSSHDSIADSKEEKSEIDKIKEAEEAKYSKSRIADFMSILPNEIGSANGEGKSPGNGMSGSGYNSMQFPQLIGVGGGAQGGLRKISGKAKLGTGSGNTLLTGNRSNPYGVKILTLKWEYRFLTTFGVRLVQPSGWGKGDASIESAPWLISSPAIIQDKNSISIVSGTEEGSGEFNPSNSNTKSSGRYVCISNKGEYQWEYLTDNNAGRASPLVFDYHNNTEILGGSTSGWMVHLFNKLGSRIWRFESEGKANFIASPALVDIVPAQTGPEIFALDLNGQLYCLSHSGHKIWSKQVSEHPAITTPAIYDVDNDGNMEIVVAGTKISPSGPSSILQCLNAKTGEVKWVREVHNETTRNGWYFQASSPAIIPDSDTPKITVGMGNKLYAFNGKTGKITWKTSTDEYIYSSPAVGDCDGDNRLEVVFGSLDGNVYCMDSETGKQKWIYKTSGQIYSSPALAAQNRVAPFQVEWSMFRNSKQRTGYYENDFTKGLDVIIGSDDGSLYVIDGKDGHLIDRFSVKFPELTVAGSNHGPLKFISSPVVADIDGDRKLEIIFTLVDRMVCITDNRR